MGIKDEPSLMFLLLISISSVTAQNAPGRLEDETNGFSFGRPAGWEHIRNSEGFYFTNTGKTIIIAVRPHAYRDFPAFWAEANLQRDKLELLGQPEDVKGGKYFRTVSRGSQTMIIDTLVMFSPFGGGVTVVGLAVERAADASFKTAATIAASTKFGRPQSSPNTDRVRNALAGKLLTYLYTGNGYSERIDIVLCSSGTAYRSTDLGGFSPSSSDGPSFAAHSQKAGKWRLAADGGVLVVSMGSGDVFEYRLASRSSAKEISLNNKRFFVQDQTICK